MGTPGESAQALRQKMRDPYKPAGAMKETRSLDGGFVEEGGLVTEERRLESTTHHREPSDSQLKEVL